METVLTLAVCAIAVKAVFVVTGLYWPEYIPRQRRLLKIMVLCAVPLYAALQIAGPAIDHALMR